MLQLAIETSSTSGSVALLTGDRVLEQSVLNSQQRSAQSLAPVVEKLLGSAKIKPFDIELISVTAGPGSFTGLRVGVTTAKTFAYAVGAEVLGVNTLEVIASQAPASVRAVWAAIDAQRDELFVAKFVRDETGEFAADVPTRIVGAEAWLESLQRGDAVSGPGLDKLASRLPAHVELVEQTRWNPLAATVGQVAWRNYARGERQELLALVPIYFRRTAAEEQWERKEQPK